MFFFSSRRRHTRYWRDWSSDVCSSDLIGRILIGEGCRRRACQSSIFTRYYYVVRPSQAGEIGRASCRERVYILVGAVTAMTQKPTPSTTSLRATLPPAKRHTAARAFTE